MTEKFHFLQTVFQKLPFFLDHFLPKFLLIYLPKQELSLDEAMINWQGWLRYKTYNPGKLTKHRILVWMISKSETGYICHLEIYTGEGKKLQETILLVLQAYLHSQYHIYKDNYYNSMPTSEILLKNKSGVCGTIRQSWLPNQLKEKSKNLQRGEMTFFRKGEVILIWKYKRRLFCMMKTICENYFSIYRKGRQEDWPSGN